MTAKEASVASPFYRRQSLRATVLRACRKCGAPGYWHDVPGVNPGCYAPEKVTHLGQDPVGDVCPQCGTRRDAPEVKGEIWSKEYRTALWPAMKAAIWDVTKPLRRRRRS